MVATKGNQAIGRVHRLLKHGSRDNYNVDYIGYNSRIDTLQAAVLLAKFKYIDEFNNKRRKIADAYNDGLRDVKGLVLPVSMPRAYHVCHQYTIRLAEGSRDDFQKHLKDHGVSTMIYYPYPLHKMKVFGEGRSRSFGSLANSEMAAHGVLSLPVEPLQSLEDTGSVIDSIRKYFTADRHYA